ncbi:MAG: PKD domain-containing protein, partial [Candidatus Thorarchaeota archaeon]
MNKNTIFWTAIILVLAVLNTGFALAAITGGDAIVSISPDYPNEDQSLNCGVEDIGNYDPDGFLYKWYKNSVYDSSASDYGNDAFSSSKTQVGDVIKCEVFMPDVLPPYLPIPISEDYRDTVTIQNRNPYVNLVSPSNGASNLELSVQLDWNGGDIDEDSVTYDVYLSTSFNPTTRIQSSLSASQYTKSGLAYNTKYYWKVVVRDNHGATATSLIWSFTTEKEPVPPPTITITSPSEGKVFNSQDVVLKYIIDQDGTVRFYDNDHGISMTSNSAGTWDYTFKQLSRGTHKLSAEIDNSNGNDIDDVTIRVNKYPILDAVGSKSVTETNKLSFSISGNDPDGDDVMYVVYGLPDGAKFENQLFTWTPTYLQAGVYYVTFKIVDEYALSDSEQVKITVYNKNRAPYVNLKTPLNGVSNQDLNVDVTWEGGDVDGQDVIYDVFFGTDSTPDNGELRLEGATVVSFDPGTLAYNTKYYWKVEVTDGTATTRSGIWSFTTEKEPVPPPMITITSPSEGKVFNSQDVVLKYTIDQDGTVRFYDNDHGIASASKSAGNREYTYELLSRGMHTLKVQIENVNGQDSDDVTIRVNKYPILDAVGSKSVTETNKLSFSISGNDPDGDSVSYSAKDLPSGASFSGTTFSWIPTTSQAGTYNVTFEIKDYYGLTDNEIITITVNDYAVHDLRAGSIVYTPLKTEGEALNWSTKIYNDGNKKESSIVRFYVNNVEQTDCRKFFSNLAAGASTSTYECRYYGTAGDYNLKASVDAVSGETDTSDNSWDRDATISNNHPDVTAKANPSSGLEDLEVQFTCTVEGGNAPFSYSWDFNDGGSSTAQNPKHTYTTHGSYSARCTVTDDDGDVDSDYAGVTVYQDFKPTVFADATPKSGLEPLEVQFTCQGTGGNAPLTYLWAFGDGSSSLSQNPKHTYTSYGQYAAKCTVTDNDGDAASDGGNIDVIQDVYPVAKADATPKSGLEDLTVQFTCDGTGGNGELSYSWDFGDGFSVYERNPTHTYTTPGQYFAFCTVTDEDGDNDKDGGDINVYEPQPEDKFPTAKADATPKNGDVPLVVSFTCLGTGGDAPLSYSWTFGDGSSSDSQNPTHIYNTPGQYVSECTVTDIDGDSDTDGGDINVYEHLKVEAIATPELGYEPLNVYFNCNAVGGKAPYTYDWTFGNGNSASTRTAENTYLADGWYTATCIVTDYLGNSASDVEYIHVLEPLPEDKFPIVNVDANPVIDYAPMDVQFHCYATEGDAPYTYSWLFGDGSGSNVQHSTHTFVQPGTYTAKCTATDVDGDKASASISVTAKEEIIDLYPEAEADANVTSGYGPLDVQLTCEGTSGDNPLS